MLYIDSMPRVPNIRPTSIYWLIDVRPETIAAGWSNGKPFYCGKTVSSPEKRLGEHRCTAMRKSHGNVGKRVVECGEFIRIQTMEIVPVEGDWVSREKFWIFTLRLLYPGCTNVSDGGQGAAGFIHSAESRAKLSAATRGRKLSPEHIAKVSAASKEMWKSPEHVAKVRAALTGKKRSSEHTEKLRNALTGRKLSPEHIAKMRAGLMGRKLSSEQKANISAGCRGKKRSPEHSAKMSAILKGKKRSPESCARIGAAKLGRKHSIETRAKMAVAQQRRRSISARAS